MADTNINDRRSIEQAYSRQDFEADVGANSDAKAQVHRGVRIPGPANARGEFSLVRASRHVGELDAASETVFLAPVRSFDAALKPTLGYGEAEGQPGTVQPEPDRAEDAYAAFIDGIVAAVGSADFEPPIAAQDERLKGFHGG